MLGMGLNLFPDEGFKHAENSLVILPAKQRNAVKVKQSGFRIRDKSRSLPDLLTSEAALKGRIASFPAIATASFSSGCLTSGAE